jgi:hypothetical protein
MRLNPREAHARRVAAAEAQILSAKINECRLIAAMLWHTNLGRMSDAEGRAAIEAEYRKWPISASTARFGALHHSGNHCWPSTFFRQAKGSRKLEP